MVFDPRWIATGLEVVTSLIGAKAKIEAGKGVVKTAKRKRQAAYFEAEQLEQVGGQEFAVLQREAIGERRKADVCLVWALDRVTREGIAKIFELINRFQMYGVQVISLQESWTEQTGPMADLLYAITAWVAEFESRRRSETTLAGLARALQGGKKLGRPKGSKDKHKRNRRGYLLRYASPALREKYTK